MGGLLGFFQVLGVALRSRSESETMLFMNSKILVATFSVALSCSVCASDSAPKTLDAPKIQVQTSKALLEHLGPFVGKKVVSMGDFGADVISALPRDAGFYRFRFVRPLEALTMDYDAHRVNIYLDADSVVVGFRVG